MYPVFLFIQNSNSSSDTFQALSKHCPDTAQRLTKHCLDNRHCLDCLDLFPRVALTFPTSGWVGWWVGGWLVGGWVAGGWMAGEIETNATSAQPGLGLGSVWQKADRIWKKR